MFLESLLCMPGNLESIKPYSIAIKYLAYLSLHFHLELFHMKPTLKQFITGVAHFKLALCICWHSNIVIDKRFRDYRPGDLGFLG